MGRIGLLSRRILCSSCALIPNKSRLLGRKSESATLGPQETRGSLWRACLRSFLPDIFVVLVTSPIITHDLNRRECCPPSLKSVDVENTDYIFPATAAGHIELRDILHNYFNTLAATDSPHKPQSTLRSALIASWRAEHQDTHEHIVNDRKRLSALLTDASNTLFNTVSSTTIHIETNSVINVRRQPHTRLRSPQSSSRVPARRARGVQPCG